MPSSVHAKRLSQAKNSEMDKGNESEHTYTHTSIYTLRAEMPEINQPCTLHKVLGVLLIKSNLVLIS